MRGRSRFAVGLVCAGIVLAASGCAQIDPLLEHLGGGDSSTRRSHPRPDQVEDVRRRAQEERARRLENEVERLRADLRRAEEALVAAESGLRSSHSRADAISSLAETRIQVERAAHAAPWRAEAIAEARAKLDEADRKVQAGYFGSAMFFVYRAQRIASDLEREARQVQRNPGARFVSVRRVNLRSEPSTAGEVLDVLTRGTPVFPHGEQRGWLLVRTPNGPAGWIYAELVSESATATQSRPASLAR